MRSVIRKTPFLTSTLFFAMFFVLSSVISLALNQENKKLLKELANVPPTQKANSLPTPPPLRNIEIINGNYIDSDNGYSFSFPKEFFKTQNPGHLSSEAGEDDPSTWNEKKPVIQIITDAYRTDNFEKVMLDLPVGLKLKSYDITKLSNIAIDDMRGITYFQGKGLVGQSGSPDYSYTAQWLEGKGISPKSYFITLRIYDDDNYEQYKPIFDNIVSSFRLTTNLRD